MVGPSFPSSQPANKSVNPNPAAITAAFQFFPVLMFQLTFCLGFVLLDGAGGSPTIRVVCDPTCSHARSTLRDSPSQRVGPAFETSSFAAICSRTCSQNSPSM